MADLSILVVSKLEPYALPFLADMAQTAVIVGAEFVVAIDGDHEPCLPFPCRTTTVKADGYLENALDDAIAACRGEWILRLDDDERCSPMMVAWLHAEKFLEADHWKFPRVHLWGDRKTALLTEQLWPDWQTRLSTKAKSGGRPTPHAGSPFGGGEEAPVTIEHHKFLVKTKAEREEIAARYDAFTKGYGTGGMLAFSLPEDAYRNRLVEFAYAGNGDVSAGFSDRRFGRIDDATR